MRQVMRVSSRSYIPSSSSMFPSSQYDALRPAQPAAVRHTARMATMAPWPASPAKGSSTVNMTSLLSSFRYTGSVTTGTPSLAAPLTGSAWTHLNWLAAVDNKRLRVVHTLDVHPQMKGLQAPPLPVCYGLTGCSHVCLRCEEPAKPDFEVTKCSTFLSCHSGKLTQSSCEVRDPLGDRGSLGDLVLPPVSGDSAYTYIGQILALSFSLEK
jgi:hypothetical protein